MHIPSRCLDRGCLKVRVMTPSCGWWLVGGTLIADPKDPLYFSPFSPSSFWQQADDLFGEDELTFLQRSMRRGCNRVVNGNSFKFSCAHDQLLKHFRRIAS